MQSSSKAEWIALSVAVKEVMFVIQLLGSMKILVKFPVIVKVDNLGAMFIASNITTMSCTKHEDIRYKYENDYVEDGAVEIIFVKSAENDSNILIKTLSTELHEKHSKKMVGKKLEEVTADGDSQFCQLKLLLMKR